MIFSGGPDLDFWLSEKILETTNQEMWRLILGLVGIAWMAREGWWVRGLEWLFGRHMAFEMRRPSSEDCMANRRNTQGCFDKA